MLKPYPVLLYASYLLAVSSYCKNVVKCHTTNVGPASWLAQINSQRV